MTPAALEAPIDPDRLLDTFLELVRIDSPSKEEAACTAYCAHALSAAGCLVTFDESAGRTGSNTGNLIAELPGTAPGTLILSAHLDTVEPGRGVEPVISEGRVFSAAETVLGADDKAGLAAAIECVRALAASSAPRPTLRCVFTVQEEVGLVGAKALAAESVAGGLCLVLDADGRPGGIVIGAPTHYTFTAAFIGRASHAGVAPERGISAIEIAAEAVAQLPLGRIDEATTANVGTIAGGSATNVVAARVEITGECRSRVRTRVEEVRARMEEVMRATAERHGGGFEIEWCLEYEGFELAEDCDEVQIVTSACRSVGLVPDAMVTGGGSDANVIAARGVPTVALACGMEGVHSTDEQIAIADLEALARLCVAVAHRVGTRAEG